MFVIYYTDMEYNYNTVDMDKFHGNSNDEMNNLYSTSSNRHDDCGSPRISYDADRGTQLSNIHSSEDCIVQESTQVITSKPSISNQRILEDLSHSKTLCTSLHVSNTQKQVHDQFPTRSQILIDQQHEMGLAMGQDCQRQLQHPISNGIPSSETSIHISFSDNYGPEHRENVSSPSRHLGFNHMSNTSYVNGASKASSRSLRVHLHSDLAVVERTKLEKKRERNRLAASKCRQRKMEKIQTLEEQVDELQNKIKNMQQQIIRLSCENTNLKTELKNNLTQNASREYTDNSLRSTDCTDESSNQLFCNQNQSIATFLSTGDQDISNNTESDTLLHTASGKMVTSNLYNFHEDHKKSGQNDLNNGDIISPDGPDSTSLDVENDSKE